MTSSIAERIRFLARGMGLVFLLGWGVWFYPLDDLLDRQGTPLGADFSMFYVAGQVAADGASDRLYVQAEHQQRLHQLFPGLSTEFCLPFRYPPVVAFLMAPLAHLPYPAAWGVFASLSCVALGLSIWILSILRPIRLPDWRSAAVWACIGWPVALEVLIGGQASNFGLLIAVAGSLLLQRKSPVAAGAVLALSAYKPNLLALFAIGVAVRYPRVILGAIPVLVALLGLNCWAGPKPLLEYGALTAQLASGSWDVETPFWKVHSLANGLEWFAPGRGKTLSLLIGCAAAITLGSWWRSKDHSAPEVRSIAPALLLVVNALFNQYTPIYDLVLLSAAAWLAADAFARRQVFGPVTLQLSLAALFFGPHLSQAVARPLGVQLFPLVLLSVALVIGGGWMARGRSAASAELPVLSS